MMKKKFFQERGTEKINVYHCAEWWRGYVIRKGEKAMEDILNFKQAVCGMIFRDQYSAKCWPAKCVLCNQNIPSVFI